MIQTTHSMALSLGELAAIMRKRKISPTVQRLAVAEVLLSRQTHMSAEELYSKVNSQRDAAGKPRVSKATIYNTLGLFSQQGLIKEVLVDSTKVFYDSNTEDHYHLFNLDSGEIEDIPATGVHVDGLPELPDGISLEGIDIIVRVKNHD